MKTCTACGETYNERIDFCFNDGAVLILMPSALDAPVPRLAGTPTEGTAGRLRTELTEETTPDATEETHVGAFSAHATEAPPAPRRRDEEPTAAILAAAVSASAPPAPAPVNVPAPVSQGIGELPTIGAPPRAPSRSAPVAWFATGTVVAIVVVVLMWLSGLVSETGPVVLTPPEAPVAEPAPVVELAPVEPTPEPVARVPEAPSTPAPAVVASTPAPAPSSAAAAPRRTTPAPAPSRAPAPSASPWDAPAAVADATATFTSDPPGALVRIDGRLRGKTPLDVKLAPGSHDIEIALEGYITSARTLDISPGSPKIPVTLHPSVRQGNVLVVAAGWDGAILYVDGTAAGTLPVQVMLTQGNHAFEVRRGSDRARVQRAVTLADRGLTKLTLDF